MKEFAKLRLTDVPATRRDLGTIVSCVSKLPELNPDLAGSVWQLTSPQLGYVVGHFYYVYHSESYGTTKLTYIDLNADTSISASSGAASAHADRVDDDGRLQRALYWRYSNYDDVDPWICDIVVCKDGDYPANVNDGKLVLTTVEQNKYPTWKTNWYVTSFVSNEHTDVNVKYRVFHVFRSGKKEYTNMIDSTVT